MNNRANQYPRIDPTFAQRRQLERIIALGQSPAVGSNRQRDMPKFRLGPTKLAKEHNLAWRARHEIVSADHLVHTHQIIIHDDRELIRVPSLVPRDDEVPAHARRFEANSSQKEVIPLDQPRRHTKSPRKRSVPKRRCIAGATIRTRPRISGPFIAHVRSARRACDISTRASTRINALALFEPLEHLFIRLGSLRLQVRSRRPTKVRSFIPIQPKPAKVFNRRLRSLDARPRSIQVFDPQDHSSAGMPRRQPGNQKCARMPQMKPPRRRRCQPPDEQLLPVTARRAVARLRHIAIQFRRRGVHVNSCFRDVRILNT